MKDSYAVITGASQGLGRAFAAELAKENNNLILVSLPGQNLKEFAEELQTEYLVKTSCYETDASIKRKCNGSFQNGLIPNLVFICLLITPGSAVLKI